MSCYQLLIGTHIEGGLKYKVPKYNREEPDSRAKVLINSDRDLVKLFKGKFRLHSEEDQDCAKLSTVQPTAFPEDPDTRAPSAKSAKAAKAAKPQAAAQSGDVTSEFSKAAENDLVVTKSRRKGRSVYSVYEKEDLETALAEGNKKKVQKFISSYAN